MGDHRLPVKCIGVERAALIALDQLLIGIEGLDQFVLVIEELGLAKAGLRSNFRVGVFDGNLFVELDGLFCIARTIGRLGGGEEGLGFRVAGIDFAGERRGVLDLFATPGEETCQQNCVEEITAETGHGGDVRPSTRKSNRDFGSSVGTAFQEGPARGAAQPEKRGG